jgi:hypothetical protein
MIPLRIKGNRSRENRDFGLNASPRAFKRLFCLLDFEQPRLNRLIPGDELDKRPSRVASARSRLNARDA